MVSVGGGTERTNGSGARFWRGFPRSLLSAVLPGDLVAWLETELSSWNWNNTLIINPI